MRMLLLLLPLHHPCRWCCACTCRAAARPPAVHSLEEDVALWRHGGQAQCGINMCQRRVLASVLQVVAQERCGGGVVQHALDVPQLQVACSAVTAQNSCVQGQELQSVSWLAAQNTKTRTSEATRIHKFVTRTQCCRHGRQFTQNCSYQPMRVQYRHEDM
jgi:hypothetical protein